MPGKDRYSLLSKAVRIANSTALPYDLRLKSLARFLQTTIPCHSVTIYICDENRLCLDRAVSTANSRSGMLSCRIPFGKGVAGQVVGKSIPLCLSVDNCHPSEFGKGDESCFLGMPIRDEREVYGVVTFGQGSSVLPPAAEMELIDDVLVVIAGIIQRIRLSAGSRQRITNLVMLSELGSKLNRSAPPESLVPIILDTCHQQSGSCCTILRLDGENGGPRLRQYRARHSIRRSLSTLLGIEDLCSAKVRHSGIALLIKDLVSDEQLPPSYICVPLKFENRVIGSMTFFGKNVSFGEFLNFSEEDRNLFESMGTLISNAMAGAINYQQVLRLGEENNYKVKELALLYQLSNTMLSTIRLNKLMHLILSALTCGPNPLFERAMLFLINERAEVMQGMLGVTTEMAGFSNPLARENFNRALTSRWDITDEEMARQQNSEFSSQVRSTRLDLNRTKNMCSRAVFDRKLVYVPDTSRDKRVDHDFVKKYGVTSFAATPLLAKDKVLGVVVVDNPHSAKPISPDDLRFLELCTNQAGMAIENSLLYSRIEDANRRLTDAQERLLHGERLATIGEMAAGIAHELKSPLVSIGGFARRLSKKLHKSSEEAEYVATIIGEVDRLEKMLTDILAFSRKSTLCYSVCSMQEIIEDALAVVMPVIEEHQLKVIRQFPRKLLSFLGDAQQMKQVFINFFTNAQEAMSGTAGEIRVTASNGKLAGRDAVIVKVADTGGGIPLNSLGNIFNPFFTTKESGTGLGLPIANRIVTNHGGKIQISNYPEVGVEFMVIIPTEPPPVVPQG